MDLKNCYCFILTLSLLAGLSSCTPKPKNIEESDPVDSTGGVVLEDIEDLIKKLPEPSGIPSMVQQTGARYNESLLNPRSKTDKYTTRVDKAALNLGVYSADIGYLILYDKTQEAIDYLNSCKILADNLGVIGSFEIGLIRRFEKNIANKDSLTRLVNQATEQTRELLRDNVRIKLSVLVLTGSFIEGFSISTGLVNSYPKSLLPTDTRNLIFTQVIQVIRDQKESVSILLKILASVEQTEPVSTLVRDMMELEKAYEGLNIDEQIKNNRADLMLNDKSLMEITSIVGRIRTFITE